MVEGRTEVAPAPPTVAARASVRALAVAPTDGPTAAADLPEMLAMRAELDAAIAARLQVVDATETWQETGAKAQWAWLARHALTPATDPDDDDPGGAGGRPVRPAPMSEGTARGWVHLAKDLQAFPVVRDAVASGTVSTDHARVVCSALRDLAKVVAGTVWTTPEWLGAQEAAVLAAARVADPVRLRKELRARLQALAPLPASVDAEQRRAKRNVKLTPGYDGMWNLTGLLDPEAGQLLHTALQAWRRDDHKAGDSRTPGQRDADALTALAEQFLAAGLTTQRGVTPHVVVLVPEARMSAHEALGQVDSSGAAVPDPFLRPLIDDGGEPMPSATWLDGTAVPEPVLSRVLCTGRLTRLVLDAEGRPLDVGRTQRTFTWPMWLAAMTATDGRCAVEGCHAPPERLELHHARWWSDGGTTALDNCVPLCHGTASCHTRVHDGHVRVLRDGRVLDRTGLHAADEHATPQVPARVRVVDPTPVMPRVMRATSTLRRPRPDGYPLAAAPPDLPSRRVPTTSSPAAARLRRILEPASLVA